MANINKNRFRLGGRILKISNMKTIGDWSDVLNDCNTTVNKEDVENKEVSSSFKSRLLMSEHSPIRDISIKWMFEGLKSWISVHLVRHHVGIDHFVSTQRTDRTGVNRDESLQSQEVNHKCTANQQAMIDISRKRLCHQASLETRQAWQQVIGEVKNEHPELARVCVKECVYRNGLCPEMKTCGYNMTSKFEDELQEYVDIVKNQINPKSLI